MEKETKTKPTSTIIGRNSKKKSNQAEKDILALFNRSQDDLSQEPNNSSEKRTLELKNILAESKHVDEISTIPRDLSIQKPGKVSAIDINQSETIILETQYVLAEHKVIHDKSVKNALKNVFHAYNRIF
jgi:hypothetical protein